MSSVKFKSQDLIAQTSWPLHISLKLNINMFVNKKVTINLVLQTLNKNGLMVMLYTVVCHEHWDISLSDLFTISCYTMAVNYLKMLYPYANLMLW